MREQNETPAEQPTGAESSGVGTYSSSPVESVVKPDDVHKHRVLRERIGVFDWRKKIRETSVPSRAKLVGLMLSTYMNEEGGSCFPSLATLAANTNLNKETVVFALDDLDAAGYIDRGSKDQRRGGSGRKTHYLATVPKSVGLSAETVVSSAKKSRVNRPEYSKKRSISIQATTKRPIKPSPPDPLVARVCSVVEKTGPKIRAEAEALVAHFAAFVDPRLIDEAIGIAATLEERPQYPRAVGPLIERNARMRGISTLPFDAKKKSA